MRLAIHTTHPRHPHAAAPRASGGQRARVRIGVGIATAVGRHRQRPHRTRHTHALCLPSAVQPRSRLTWHSGPTAVVYGAFAYTRLGDWPVYSRNGLADALAAGGFGRGRGFVAKPASDGTNFGILVMTPERWQRENWTFALVSRHVERFLYKERSSWGQWYEQRGVVIQPMYTDGAPSGLRWPRGLAEMNVLVHLGRPVHIRVMQVHHLTVFHSPCSRRAHAVLTPCSHRSSSARICVTQIPKVNGAGCFDVRLHENGSHTCLPTSNCPNPQATCERYSLRFSQALPQVGTYVRRLATFFGADWFRFDYFWGHPHRMMRINEVRHPRACIWHVHVHVHVRDAHQ